MQDFVITIGGWILGLAVTIGSGILKMIFGRLKHHEDFHVLIEKRLDDHRLHVAENYSPKTEMKDLKDTIVAHLVRIEDKLDKKADK